MRVWIDREAIAGGTSWGRQIVEGIEHCSALLICCTERAMQSRNVKQEIQLAWRYEKPYLPLLLERVTFSQEVLDFLEGWQWVEGFDREPSHYLPAVLKALRRLGLEPAAPGTAAGVSGAAAEEPAVVPTSPGVAGFQPQAGSSIGEAAPSDLLDLDAFVGREKELPALRAGLQRVAGGRGRLVLIAGEPGIGKTRLARELAAEAREGGARVF